MHRVISAIVAMSENRVIGHKNQLPWHLPADLKHFKTVTLNHTVLMGRKTYESIGKPLSNRRNVILTQDRLFKASGCEVVHDLQSALALDDLYIIGGAQIFELCGPYINKLYLTLIHKRIEGDAFFPELDLKRWKLISREDHQADDKNLYDYSFLELERVSKPHR